MPAGTSYTFKEGMLAKQFKNIDVDNDGKTDHYSFEIKNQFLHAIHPVGWICELQVRIDGKEIDPENMYFVLRGQWFHFPKMYTITETFWNLCETAEIYIRCNGGIDTGKHRVQCVFISSMLEDTHILDMDKKWPRRTETVEGELYA